MLQIRLKSQVGRQGAGVTEAELCHNLPITAVRATIILVWLQGWDRGHQTCASGEEVPLVVAVVVAAAAVAVVPAAVAAVVAAPAWPAEPGRGSDQSSPPS